MCQSFPEINSYQICAHSDDKWKSLYPSTDASHVKHTKTSVLVQSWTSIRKEFSLQLCAVCTPHCKGIANKDNNSLPIPSFEFQLKSVQMSR